MKVLFISDFSLQQNNGGAQVSNQFIIDHGTKIGHDITLHNFDSSYTDFLYSYDCIISSNLEAIFNRTPDKLNFIINHPNHFRLEHDSCSYLDTYTRKQLFSSSKINFFLSEFHISFFRSMYGDIFNNIEIVADPINTELFTACDQEKIYDIVYCGFLHELKGLKNLIKFSKQNKHRKIDVFGWGITDPTNLFKDYENIKYHGKVDHQQTAEIYQQAQAVFHHPIVNEPFCRMIAEALLCGIEEFYGDENKIGSLQECNRLGIEKFAYNCHNAPEIFWDKINSKI
jgi:glycosyltransferase involved in cell wall biosynthesis